MELPFTTAKPIRYVYFIESERLGMVKIGCASDPEARRATMQVGSADKLILRGLIASDDAAALEGMVHHVHARDRAHGEWFHPTPDVRADAEAMSNPASIAVLFGETGRTIPAASIKARKGEKAPSIVRRLVRAAAKNGYDFDVE